MQRTRVSSFTVEIPNQEKLEKPDQHEILECALATSRGKRLSLYCICSHKFFPERSRHRDGGAGGGGAAGL